MPATDAESTLSRPLGKAGGLAQTPRLLQPCHVQQPLPGPRHRHCRVLGLCRGRQLVSQQAAKATDTFTSLAHDTVLTNPNCFYALLPHFLRIDTLNGDAATESWCNQPLTVVDPPYGV
uniref:Uncharacterized protein n=1 Tax=Mycena chlorophos TaxID=658473 RepID=A0ABQ0LZ48_MYCCL|nr:predicted protein [Mycena chlorophos]